MLSPFQCVLTPDFSLYADMPLAQQMHNVYRSRLIGAYCQRHGMSVIPTLQWSTPESYSFAFEGLPKHSVLAASTLGVLNDRCALALWRRGMDEAINRLDPRLVLLYGKPVSGFDWESVGLLRYENHRIERVKEWEAGAQRAA